MLKFSELKHLENGLVPVITQAYDTKAVLMQAWCIITAAAASACG